MYDLKRQMHLLERVSRTFALTIPQLPPALCDQVGNAYLLCRIADTIEDEPQLSAADKQIFIRLFLAVLAGETPAEAFPLQLLPRLSAATPAAEQALIAEAPAVIAHFQAYPPPLREIIHQCVQIMSQGMADYQAQACAEGLPDLEALDQYCYFVAGVVGEMLTGLFCAASPACERQRTALSALAVAFGQGLQMTNILKDVWEDRARGVCWLPRQLCAELGLDLADLTQAANEPAFGLALQRLIAIANGHLQDALDYSLLLPASEQGMRQFCLWAIGMARLTLGKLARQVDYRQASAVKISRRDVRRVVLCCRLTGRFDGLTRGLFAWWGRGLPCERRDAAALQRRTSRWRAPPEGRRSAIQT